jgi:hypothetical protein
MKMSASEKTLIRCLSSLAILYRFLYLYTRAVLFKINVSKFSHRLQTYLKRRHQKRSEFRLEDAEEMEREV